MNHLTDFPALRPVEAPPDDAQPIDGEGRIHLQPASCLALRSGPAACSACTNRCPSSSIKAGNDCFTVDADCLSCGQCAAACPTGALRVKGFENPEPLPGGNIVRVECHKVPASLSGHTAIRVPCLGGISPAQWLGIAEKAGDRRVVLIDRNWCSLCSAGSATKPDHPAQDALEQADAILSEVGWPVSRRPHFQKEPLPASLMPAEIPAERPESLARRALFRRIGREAQRAVGDKAPAEAGSARVLRRRGMQLPEREQLLSTAHRLAETAGMAMPAAPFVRLEVSAACHHHQLCARLCPTGALSLYEHDGSAGLEFDAHNCTACGLCARNCPERAIRIAPAAEAPAPQVAQRLTALSERPCARCRSPFTGADSQPECPTCRRSRQLGQALFGLGTPLADSSLTVPGDAVPSSGGDHHE